MYSITSLLRYMNIRCVFKMYMNFILNVTYVNGLKPTIFHGTTTYNQYMLTATRYTLGTDSVLVSERVLINRSYDALIQPFREEGCS